MERPASAQRCHARPAGRRRPAFASCRLLSVDAAAHFAPARILLLQARPSATPGAAAGGTPGGSAVTSRTRSRLPTAPRSRVGARTCGASEPSSPRGASSGQLLGLDAAADPLADDRRRLELLPPGEELYPAPTSDGVKVFVRVRPPTAREAAAACCVSTAGGHSVVLAEAGRPEPFTATFDRVFGPEEGQDAVYAAVGAQLVDNCMAGERVGDERVLPPAAAQGWAFGCRRPLRSAPARLPSLLPAGFNSSIFAYGQTGAGKTHTMTGAVAARGDDGALPEQCGLTLRVFRHLFERIGQEEAEGVRYTVKCWWVEGRGS